MYSSLHLSSRTSVCHLPRASFGTLAPAQTLSLAFITTSSVSAVDTAEEGRGHLNIDNQHSGEGSGTPLQYSCLENPMDGGAWWAAVYEVAQSWT